MHSPKDLVEADCTQGLAKVVVHSGGEAPLPIAVHGAGRHGDDRRVAVRALSPTDLGGCLISVDLGHLTIHEDGLVVAALVHVERYAAVRGDVHSEATLLQQAAGDELIDGVVLGHENRAPRRGRDPKGVL